MRTPSFLLLLSPLLGALACSTSSSHGTLQFVTDDTNDTFSRTPPVATLEIDLLGTDGSTRSLVKTSVAPNSTVDIGDVPADAAGYLHVVGSDAAGNVVVRGDTIPLVIGETQDRTLPVFVQRTREFDRLPGNFTSPLDAPLATVLSGRYALFAGKNDGKLAFYDLLTWAPLDLGQTPLALPRAPKSVASLGDSVLYVDATGATWLEPNGATSSGLGTVDATAPTGGAFSEVAGGVTVYDDSSNAFVVGGTRRGTEPATPTSTVLKVAAADGSLSWIHLASPRSGASAIWVDGVGVVIVGGSATGAGAELIAPGATTSTAMAFDAEARGFGVSERIDATHVLDVRPSVAASGSATAPSTLDFAVVDVSCKAACKRSAFTTATVTAAAATDVYRVADSTFLVFTVDVAGAAHAYTVDATTATETPFRVARKSIATLPFIGGEILIAGDSDRLESFVR